MVEYHEIKFLDQSMLNCYNRCPRRFFYRYGCGLCPPKHPALAFGTAIHAAVPGVYHNDITEAMNLFHEIWSDDMAPDDRARNADRARLMLSDFIYSYASQTPYKPLIPEQMLDAKDTNDLEWPFAIDIGLPIPLVGRLDGLGELRNGKKVVLEYKTASRMGTSLYTNLEYSPQGKVYNLAANAYGTETTGTIYVVLGVATKKVETYFHQVILKDLDLDTTLNWVRSTAVKILTDQEAGSFDKNISGCSTYPCYGIPGYVCEYYPLCHLVEDWHILENTYEIEFWKPFEALEGGEDKKNAQDTITENG